MILFAIAASAQYTFEFDYLKSQVLEERMRLAHPRNSERWARLAKLFAEAGCTGNHYREQAVKGSKEPNLICTLPGEGTKRIIIGAHFDSTGGGDGVVDNWSGAVMLPSLFQTLRKQSRKHTLEFVAFAAEEKGLLGSSAYVGSLSKEQREQVTAVVTLDSLGLSPTKCWLTGSDARLAKLMSILAQSMKLGFSVMNIERAGMTDSVPFQQAKIPVLSLHSVTRETWNIINGKKDVWSALSWPEYYDSYRLVSAFATLLDQAADAQ